MKEITLKLIQKDVTQKCFSNITKPIGNERKQSTYSLSTFEFSPCISSTTLSKSHIYIYRIKFLLGYLLNRDPLFGLPEFHPSHAEAQKNRDIQKRTAKKI